MIPPVEKLVLLEQQVSAEKGPFALFAIFLREDAPDRWDLVVSAPWIDELSRGQPGQDPLSYLVNRIHSSLSPEELLSISRIVQIQPGDPSLEALQRAISTEHNSVEVRDSLFFGLKIKHAYIVTSKRRDQSANADTTNHEAARRQRTASRKKGRAK